MQALTSTRVCLRSAFAVRQSAIALPPSAHDCVRHAFQAPLATLGPKRLCPISSPARFSAVTQRSFSAEASAAPVEDRVIKAVERYVAMRKDELEKEDKSDDSKRLMEALNQKVTDASSWDHLGFDELDKVEVLLEVEDEFSHIIPDDIADSIQSVKEAIDYIQKQV